MRRRIAVLFITSLILTCQARADFGISEPADYTGEAFFAPPELSTPEMKKMGYTDGDEEEKKSSSKGTIPPIKLLRLKLQNASELREQRNLELAPTAADVYMGEVGTSEYASQEITDDFQDMSPDGFDADEDFITGEQEKTKKSFFKREKKKADVEDTEDIVLDCEKVDYDTDNYLVYATGNVSVEFVKQGITVKSDVITFDRMNNTIKAEGNVRILKDNQTITGDYIFVDMNEENALIENPLTKTGTMEIKSKKGYVYGDKIVQEQGRITIDESYPIKFRSATRGPQLKTMLVPKGETLTEDMEKGIITFKAKDIKITQKGDLEIVSFTKPHLFRGDKTIFKTKSVKIYTNKNHDYGETDHWEIGSYRGLGLYAGPGFVFEMPKGSVLKAIPMLNYKSGIGVGALTRFSSGTNSTTAAYGSAEDRFVVYGKQALDDNLYMQYAVNGFMDEWFMGRRRPKYGTSLVYTKGYSADGFLLKDKQSQFQHRFEGGYFQDLDFDNNHEKIRGGGNIGTTRFRYMAQATQNLYKYVDKENLKAFRFDIISAMSSSLYGTGDTQVIGRIGPVFHMQYKRWMQDIGYYYSVYDDNTPMPVFDSYRYGTQNVYLREYFRLCRWLTLSWFGSVNVSNDSVNGRTLQENAFYFSVGPDDVKVNLGYDFVRETLRCTVELMMDAKGTNVEYDTLEIKQTKKAEEKKEVKPAVKKTNPYAAPTQPKVLDRAVVENVKELEDVI